MGKLILGMTDDEIRSSGYATHLPILDFLLDFLLPKKILEWGMGFYSTPLLIEKTKDMVFSIETVSMEWYKKVRDRYRNKSTFECVVELSKAGVLKEIPRIEEYERGWNIVFNDGDSFSRHVIAQMAQNWYDHHLQEAPVIISHDTQEKQYFYNAVLLGLGWVWMDIMDYSVWTSVLTCRTELLELLTIKFLKTKKYCNAELKNKDFTHDHGRAL